MEKETCSWCEKEVGPEDICFELWLRIPHRQDMKEFIEQARELAGHFVSNPPGMDVHDGYFDRRVLVCDFACLAQYALSRWRQGEAWRKVILDSLGPPEGSEGQGKLD